MGKVIEVIYEKGVFKPLQLQTSLKFEFIGQLVRRMKKEEAFKVYDRLSSFSYLKS